MTCDICDHDVAHLVVALPNRITGRVVLGETCQKLGCFCWRTLTIDVNEGI